MAREWYINEQTARKTDLVDISRLDVPADVDAQI
jgi:hypothetical protein